MITWYLNRKVGTKIFIAHMLAMGMVALIVGLSELRFIATRQALAQISSGVAAANFSQSGIETIIQTAAQNILVTQWLLVGVAGFTTLIGIVCVQLIARSISRPLEQAAQLAESIATGELKELAREMDEMSRGDLAHNFAVVSQPLEIHYQDEVGRLGRAFNQMLASLQDTGHSFTGMMDSMKRLIASVAANANDLAAAAQQLAEIAQQAGGATNQIAATIQQVAQGTTQQSDHAYHTLRSIESLSQSIQSIAAGAQEQARSISSANSMAEQFKLVIEEVTSRTEESAVHSTQAAEQAESSAEIVHATIAGMRDIQEKVGITAAKVQEMGERSDKIGSIVVTIEEIASQTNLLALNAAIEAARAGTHGAGFAVVADEVRKLAERSGYAAREIAALVKEIQATVHEAVESMQAGANEVEQGVARADQTGKAIAGIQEAVNSLKEQVAVVSQSTLKMKQFSAHMLAALESVGEVAGQNLEATQAMVTHASEVTQSVENIANVSQEHSAAVEEVSASTEEMSAQAEEVSASALVLSEMARTLHTLVGQFKIEPHERFAARTQPGFSGVLPDRPGKNGHEKSKQRLPA